MLSSASTIVSWSLTAASHEFLTELSQLPEKVFQREDVGEKPLRPASAAQIRSEEERIKRRRQKKTQRSRSDSAQVVSCSRGMRPTSVLLSRATE